ncbi:MAG: DUF1684 domain-containing protein [Xanthomonadales bacterium]|nr:DUF1684 domain-containing protein [Xanthomonadales bacterium]
MPKIPALLSALLAGVLAMPACAERPSSSDHASEVEAWRAGRLARLTAPDGWLSLVGLHWLREGRNTIGSGADNDIVIEGTPSHLGSVELTGGQARLELDPAAREARIEGGGQRSATLLDDSHEKPTIVVSGTTRFYLIERNGRHGLRVKDSHAKARTDFAGIDSFPIDPAWRIEAKWVTFDPPHTLEVPNVLGQVDRFPVPGKAVFERDGRTFELLPVLEEPDATELFLIFADRTSGRDTYGAGRFLYAPMPTDGRIVLDFNKAYNPPCAFTPYATCPLAPPENRLDLEVTAGERKYRGGH